jgi:GH24 family phage-related lysozyme (muramidase)
MKISKTGIDFIKGFESFVPWVYDDLRAPIRVNGRRQYAEWQGERVIGTLTIGYGHTNSAKHPLKIKQGLRVTEKEACDILDVDLDECEQAVREQVKVPLEQGMFDALVSFGFNCGTGNLKNLTKRLNRGDYRGARAAFDFYVKSKGKTLAGLQRRRDEEQALWDQRNIPPPDEIVEHTEEVDPMPQVEKAKDLRKVSRKFVVFAWIKRIAAFLGLGTGTTLTLTDLTTQSKGLSDVAETLVSNPTLLTVVVASVAVIAAVGVLEALGITDYNEGRWVPSGVE